MKEDEWEERRLAVTRKDEGGREGVEERKMLNINNDRGGSSVWQGKRSWGGRGLKIEGKVKVR